MQPQDHKKVSREMLGTFRKAASTERAITLNSKPCSETIANASCGLARARIAYSAGAVVGLKLRNGTPTAGFQVIPSDLLDMPAMPPLSAPHECTNIAHSAPDTFCTRLANLSYPHWAQHGTTRSEDTLLGSPVLAQLTATQRIWRGAGTE